MKGKFIVSGERNELLKRRAVKAKDIFRASGEEDKLFNQISNGKWEMIQSLWWRGWNDGKKLLDGEDEFRASGEEDKLFNQISNGKWEKIQSL